MEASTGCIVPYITQTFEGSFNLLIRTFWADFPHKNCQLGLDPAPPKALQNPNPPPKKRGEDNFAPLGPCIQGELCVPRCQGRQNWGRETYSYHPPSTFRFCCDL